MIVLHNYSKIKHLKWHLNGCVEIMAWLDQLHSSVSDPGRVLSDDLVSEGFENSRITSTRCQNHNVLPDERHLLMSDRFRTFGLSFKACDFLHGVVLEFKDAR